MKDFKRLAFDADERLYRTIAADQLKNGKVKPNALRPQFSVQRSRFAGEPQDVQTQGKFTGIAAITVAKVRELKGEVLNIHCIYEPSQENEAHSLIALSTDVPFGTAGVEEDFEVVRAAIAGLMDVPKQPVK